MVSSLLVSATAIAAAATVAATVTSVDHAHDGTEAASDGGSAGSAWDSVRSNTRRVVFASCFSPRLMQADFGGVLAAAARYAPDWFVWTGDAVYPKDNSVASLRRVYEQATEDAWYSALVEVLGGAAAGVDGTWDDNDLGVNDGGAAVAERAERQRLFLDFIGKGGVASRAPETRDGVYSAHRVDLPGGRRVGVVLLDTRSHREPHAIPSLGYFRWVPLISVFSAGTRWVAAFCGLYNTEATVLGDAQWRWLERIVAEEAPALDGLVVVSSIQVTTTNPIVESWGHFPAAKKRLLTLLDGLNTVVFVSGDVHFAEVGGHEVTSSGVTHTAVEGKKRLLALPVQQYYSSHRDAPVEKHVFGGKNWLALDLPGEEASAAAGGGDASLRFSVRDENGNVVIPKAYPLGRRTELLRDIPLNSFAATEATEEEAYAVAATAAVAGVSAFFFFARLLERRR
eukprot:Rhum_TRINITY_DN22949_c0_g1::Rhum_TRINITY_DN22949_c0_g1_i1::g.176616::m.176616/K01113/phoD; alkaline phosphatase D